MNSIVKITLVVLGCAAAPAVVIYHYRTNATTLPAHAVIARDRSESVLTDCRCTEALVEEALKVPNMGRGSKLTIIANGDKPTADEPLLIGSYNVPTSRRVVEGRNATQHKQDALLADVKSKCESLPVTTRSPIVLMIRRGIERLQQLGCNSASGCVLYVQTDAEETAEAQVKKLLESGRSGKPVASEPLIDNEGICIVFYGLSQTAGERETRDGRRQRFTRGRNTMRAEQLREAWLSVFSDRERVRFEPFCPTN
ncbi:MAG: hypothetical protein ABR568_15010 [Pyrinomonadaceae bacterium]